MGSDGGFSVTLVGGRCSCLHLLEQPVSALDQLGGVGVWSFASSCRRREQQVGVVPRLARLFDLVAQCACRP